MLAVRNVLMSGMRGPQLNAIPNGTYYTPEIRADAAVETIYTLVVEGIEGSPASALLNARFQIANRSTRGVYGKGFGEDNFTDKKYAWQTIDAVNHEHLLPGGDWPTRIANQSTAGFPMVITRRIKGGMSNRLAITSTQAGGGRSGTVNTTNGSANLANVTGPFVVGENIAGPGIPAGAVITAYNSGAGTMTISRPATATAAGVALNTQGAFILSLEAKVIY